MECLLEEGNHPEWLTNGQTVLLIKDPQQEPIPKNYRPIMCLLNIWKLLSGIVAVKLEEHMSHYMTSSQKKIELNTRGAKHRLLVDRTLYQDSRRRHTDVSMAWIDYKKAYDSIPHSRILVCLSMYNVYPALVALINMSMTKLKTELEAKGKNLASVKIR
ncbi:uncharacterized protein [Watersipora subatra]|uniref:uncharacterized protein n=1 Tax=Watersipora subatra TaxID=2589382 RepID=UPI00355BDC29